MRQTRVKPYKTAVVSTEKAKAFFLMVRKKRVGEGGRLYICLCCSDIRNSLYFKG